MAVEVSCPVSRSRDRTSFLCRSPFHIRCNAWPWLEPQQLAEVLELTVKPGPELLVMSRVSFGTPGQAMVPLVGSLVCHSRDNISDPKVSLCHTLCTSPSLRMLEAKKWGPRPVAPGSVRVSMSERWEPVSASGLVRQVQMS